LPIAETQEGNLSAYISTNLISISDGQIVLDARLFHEGQKPAVNVGRSVSRVGGKTQSEAMRRLAEKLKLEYAQFLELEIFTRFGGMVDERTRNIVEHGRRIRTILTQPQYAPLSLAHQVALLLAIEEKLIDRLPADRMAELRTKIGAWLETQGREQGSRINATGDLDGRGRSALVAAITELIEHTA
jgi:F-type H+-transporting ATPase subunit alpha